MITIILPPIQILLPMSTETTDSDADTNNHRDGSAAGRGASAAAAALPLAGVWRLRAGAPTALASSFHRSFHKIGG